MTSGSLRPGMLAAAIGVAVSVLLWMGWTATAQAAAITDPAGDISAAPGESVADYDIVAARSAVKNRHLFLAVRVAGEARIGDDHTVRGSGIEVEINTAAKRPGDCNGNSRDPLGRAEYIFSASGNPSVIDCTGTGIPEARSVRAVSRGNTLITAIPLAMIGNPNRLGWFASTRYWDGSTEQFDFAPERGSRPGMVLQKVGAAGPGGNRWQDCGNPPSQGAGSWDVRALRMNCRLARRIAKVYPFNPDAVKQAGWNCKARQTGYESSVAQCLLRTDVLRAVRFKFGA